MHNFILYWLIKLQISQKSHDILQLRTTILLNRTTFNLDGTKVTHTRETRCLNVPQPNHLTEKLAHLFAHEQCPL